MSLNVITMNKYIKTDIESAVIQMKAALMNALYDIDSGEETEIDLGDNISWNLFDSCLIEAGWKVDETKDYIDTNGWEVDFWSYWYSPSGKYCCIKGSLWRGQSYNIKVWKNKE